MRYSIRSSRISFLIIQYIYLLSILILFQFDAIEESPLMLFLMSVWNIVSYTYIFYKELKCAPEINPFMLLSLSSIMYIGVNGVVLSNKMFDGESIRFGSSILNNTLTIGLWFLSLQHALTYTSYYYVLNKHINQVRISFSKYILRSTINYRSWALAIYKYIWGLRILDIIIHLNSYSSFIWNISNKAQLITLTLLTFSLLRNPTDKKTLKWFWIIVLIEIVWVLGEGSKQGIITNLIPYLLYLLIGYKIKRITINKNLILSLGGIAIFIVFVVFPYVSVFRDIAFQKNIPWSEVSITEAIEGYGDYILGEGNYKDSADDNKSTSYLAERAGAITCNTWAIDYAQENGPEIKYLLYNALSLIPRFIWPNKPPNVVGSMLYHLSYGDPQWEVKSLIEYESGATLTYVSAGFIGGCYFSMGPIAAIFFPLFAGWFIARFWIFLRDKLYYNIIAIWAFYTIIDVVITDFESFDDCGILFYLYSVFYIFIIKYIFPLKKYSKLLNTK